MSFFQPQNPGLSGLDELTSAEEALVQSLSALGDPGADRILFWDESANAYAFLTIGSGLSITGTTISSTGGGSSTFISLTDAPASYTGQSLKSVRVNVGETGLEFFTAAGTGTVTSVGFTGGIISVATATTTPAFTVAGTSGGIPYFSSASTWATSAALAANALVVGGGAGVAPATVTTGTGVLTALGVNVGSAGAFVTFNGALGTPSSGTVTNLTGTASININGTVGATTPSTGVFTTLVATAATSLLLGTAGSAVGSVGFRNATSGTITLAPVAGALGTVTLTLPAITDTLATLAGTETFSNKTLTAPKFADLGFIADANGNEMLIFDTVASAVNEITLANAATTGTPTISATGSDSNISIQLTPKGTGIVKGELKRFMVRLLSSTTAQTTGTTIGGDYRISNRAITVKAVGAYVDTAGTTGVCTFNIKEAGTTILSTKITIDSTEKTSETAATAPVISDASIAADAIVTFDIDGIQTTPANGLTVWVDYVFQ